MAVSRPHMAAAAEAPDLLSDQPDEVLETIVSLLSIKDGCRTQALSRRWRPIWRSAPLDLDTGRDRLTQNTISDVLSGHLGPVRRITITIPEIGPLPPRYRYSNVGSWLSGYSNVMASVQVLDLCDLYDEVLPASMFSLATALQVATFTRCSLPTDLALVAVISLPSLERLSLVNVTGLTEETLCALLSGCPALRSLLLQYIQGTRRLRINSPSLRSICFSVPWDKSREDSGTVQLHELLIEDAPCLERLLPLNPYNNSPPIIQLLRAPKLEILGFLCKGIAQLHLGRTNFQKMIAASLTTTMPTVKVLALNYVGPDLDAVLDFLRCFPCLERMYIILGFDQDGDGFNPPMNIKTVRKYTLPNDPIECLKFRLKKVALKVYKGTPREIDFARFFVLNAKVLERMEFGLMNDCKDTWRESQNMQLQVGDRASSDARFEFKKFARNTFIDISMHTHDLSTADPFNASFLKGYVTIWQV